MSLIHLLGLVVAVVPSPSAPPASLAVVTVRATPQVSGRTFRLGEIADVATEDKAFADQLSAVEVGTSPLPGLTRSLSQGDIVIRLRAQKIDPKRVTLACPPLVRIARASSEIPADGLTEAAQTALEAAHPKGGDCTFEAMPMTTKLFANPGKMEYRAGAPRGRTDGAIATVPVTVLVDGAPVKTIDVSFRIKRTVPAVVATRALDANTVLTESDLSVTRVETNGGPAPLADPTSLIGKRLKRRIEQGKPFTESAVGEVMTLACGARVTVISVSGGVSVTGTGTARSAGAIGEPVRIFVNETKKEVLATVVDASTVRVEDGK